MARKLRTTVIEDLILFAPGGFSASARSWAKGKHIILADETEISRLVESAYGGKV